MRLSRYFLPVLKESPKEAEIVSHKLMLRAGMIKQQAAGSYSWLPLGFKVLQKVVKIVEEEQDRSGAVELLMPTLQSADLWRESGRYDAYGKEMLRLKDRHERDMLYGPTNEEMITDIFRTYVRSYKDLPLNLYHVQWKFRDEVRPRFGTMRSREFLMKDAYSFDLDRAGADEGVPAHVRRVSAHLLPLGRRRHPDARRQRADRRRHELRIPRPRRHRRERGVPAMPTWSTSPSRRSTPIIRGDLAPIFKDWTSLYAATDEMVDEAKFKAEVPADKQLDARGIEVGHIFYFGTKYSEPMKATRYRPRRQGNQRAHGQLRHRPEPPRPRDHRGQPRRRRHHLAGQRGAVRGRADQPQGRRCRHRRGLRHALCRAWQPPASTRSTTIATSRPAPSSPTADLIGIPYQLILGPRGLKEGQAEIKHRKTGERETLPLGSAVERLKALIEPQRRDKV